MLAFALHGGKPESRQRQGARADGQAGSEVGKTSSDQWIRATPRRFSRDCGAAAPESLHSVGSRCTDSVQQGRTGHAGPARPNRVASIETSVGEGRRAWRCAGSGITLDQVAFMDATLSVERSISPW